MKLVLFAHTPPPHHGQSYMTQLLLDGLGGDARCRAPGSTQTPQGIEVFHVNARLSSGAEDIGRARWHKLFLLLRHCAEALWCRVRHGAAHLYYVPAAPARVPLYRDWMVMALCRPFFRTLTLHWHAAGLGEWIGTQARPWERAVTRWLLGGHALSLVLAESNRRDAEALGARRIEVVPNGIPDPCPDFESTVLPRRIARAKHHATLVSGASPAPQPGAEAGDDAAVFRVCFLGLCSQSKGVFDAARAVQGLNQLHDSRGARLEATLTAAGSFPDAASREEFEQLAALAGRREDGSPVVRWVGFLDARDRNKLLHESDCFCFPTIYEAENLPLVVLEAMASGLPVVATRWRAIPEMLPAGWSLLVAPNSPAEVTARFELMLREPPDPLALRERFRARFTLSAHIESVARALRTLDASCQ